MLLSTDFLCVFVKTNDITFTFYILVTLLCCIFPKAKMPFDANKLYCSEILAILLQNNDSKFVTNVFCSLKTHFSLYVILLSL